MADNPEADAEELCGRPFMVMGVDENGDSHLFSTSDLGRAVERYRLMKSTMRDERGNMGLEDEIRPRDGGVN